MNVREKLNASKTAVGVGAGLLILACFGFMYYYWYSSHIHFDPMTTYYSDDDGQTYYKDSTYKFPPYDHDGKTAEEAVVGISNGTKFVAFLMRFTPDARKKLQDKYDDAVKNGLPVQREVLDLMGTMPISMGGMEAKLAGPGHKWVPRSQFDMNTIKAPNGREPDDYLNQP